MKIGIAGFRIPSNERYAKLKSFGFDYYDFGMESIYDFPTGDELEKYMSKEKEHADAAGVTIWQVHGPWVYPPRDDTAENRAERLDAMKRSIHAAALLGVKYWVVHPIMPFGVQDRLNGKVAETRELNIEFMKKLLDFARQEGVIICLENMPFTYFSLSSPSEIVGLIEEISDPFLAMCLDTGHTNVCRGWHTPANALREYGRYIRVLHVHDNKGDTDRHLAPLSGTIDWQDFSFALKEICFDGVFSLECAPDADLDKELFEEKYREYASLARSISD